MLLMMNKYTATAEVRMLAGISSTTTVRHIPIHISPAISNTEIIHYKYLQHILELV